MLVNVLLSEYGFRRKLLDINENNYSIIEIIDLLAEKKLTVNKKYQRGGQLWPPGPRSYFIDTILSGYPFPKIYFYEYLDRATRKVKREIVDGQQRVSAITEFVGNKFALTNSSEHYSGMRFADLDEEVQERFLSYSVSVDVIRSARESEILEMFRRMNAYTLPLNSAEKRHSQYQGSFKWAMNRLASDYNAFFVEWGVFSNRQIVRMADAELFADMVLFLDEGITTQTSGKLSSLYKKYDTRYEDMDRHESLIKDALDFLIQHFGDLRNTHAMKPYVLLTLFAALAYNRFGKTVLDQEGLPSNENEYCADIEVAVTQLSELASAHEAKMDEGPLSRYVWACSGGTNTESRRQVRFEYILSALQGRLWRDES